MVVRSAVTAAGPAQRRRLPDTLARSTRTEPGGEPRDLVGGLLDRRPALP
jgi:hypothetical protein